MMSVGTISGDEAEGVEEGASGKAPAHQCRSGGHADQRGNRRGAEGDQKADPQGLKAYLSDIARYQCGVKPCGGKDSGLDELNELTSGDRKDRQQEKDEGCT